jgi:hypothetical protein
LLAVFDVPEPERTARLRQARIAALLLCGAEHPLVLALADAIGNPAALTGALSELAALPALPCARSSNPFAGREDDVSGPAS